MSHSLSEEPRGPDKHRTNISRNRGSSVCRNRRRTRTTVAASSWSTTPTPRGSASTLRPWPSATICTSSRSTSPSPTTPWRSFGSSQSHGTKRLRPSEAYRSWESTTQSWTQKHGNLVTVVSSPKGRFLHRVLFKSAVVLRRMLDYCQVT